MTSLKSVYQILSYHATNYTYNKNYPVMDLLFASGNWTILEPVTNKKASCYNNLFITTGNS